MRIRRNTNPGRPARNRRISEPTRWLLMNLSQAFDQQASAAEAVGLAGQLVDVILRRAAALEAILDAGTINALSSAGAAAESIVATARSLADDAIIRPTVTRDLCRAGYFVKLDEAAYRERVASRGTDGLVRVDGATYDLTRRS